jgi:hypothetical protein
MINGPFAFFVHHARGRPTFDAQDGPELERKTAMQSHFKDDAEQIFGSWVLATLLLIALAGLSLVTEDDAMGPRTTPTVATEVAQVDGVDL